MGQQYIPEPHRLVMVYDGEEGGYSILAHNLNDYDANRLAKRLSQQYDLDSHIIAHRIRHDGVGEAGVCEACHSMIDEVIEMAQVARGRTVPITTVTSDDGGGMVS